MRIFLSLCLLSIAAVAQAQLPAITDSALVKLIQGNVTWLTRVDSLKAYVNSGQAVASPTIQEETTSLTKRDTIRFVGAGITASDATTRTQVALDGDLNAIAQLSSTGYLVRTGTDSYVQRSIQASTESSSTSIVSIASGNGVSSNTVISIGTQNSTTKLNVLAATTANITLTGLQTIDNMVLQSGDRCLVKNQTNGTQNGIYDVSSGAWSRSNDLDATEGDRGVIVFVSRGTTNGNKYFKLETAPPITLGTTALSFSEVLGPSLTDGDKGDIDVSASGATWTVDTAAITTIKIADNAVDSSKVGAGALSVTDIGQHGATSGQVLKWDGSQWAPGTDNTGGGSDGNGIYSGSDTIPNNTVATHGDYFGFQYLGTSGASLEFDGINGRTSIYSNNQTSSISLTTDSTEHIAGKFVFTGDTIDISNVTTKIGFPSGGGGSQTLTLNNDSLQISGGNFVELTTVGTNYVSGFNAFRNNTLGANNYASGINALHWNSEGMNNYASGNGALYNNITGTNNYASGYQALYNNSTGNNNYASGNGALYSNTTGNNNYASGFSVLYSNTQGSNNYASGKEALFNNTTGANNYASGTSALWSNTTGSNNYASGTSALFSNTTGAQNQAIGRNALSTNTNGSYNTAVGYNSIINNQSGLENTAVGYQSGNFSGDLNNTVAIGAYSEPTQDNQIVLGNAQSTQLVTGNYKFKIDQTVGSAQDGLVLRYDHSVGEIQLGAVPIPASIISPSQITSTQNNYSPSGWADATMVRISTSNFWGINGFSSVNVSDGEEKVLYNIGTFPFYIAGGHTGSIDSNRVDVGYDYIVNPKESVRLIYDNISNRWRILSQAVTSGFRTQTYHLSPGSSTAGDWSEAGFAALSSGTVGISGAGATLPASMSLATGAAALTGAYIGFPKSINNSIRFQGAHLAIEGFVSLSALSVAADTFVAGIQIAPLNANEILLQNNSISLIYSHYINGGNWSLVSRDNAGNNSSFVDTGISVAANVGYHLRLEINDAGTEARAYINNNFAGLVNTNMPASTATPGGRAVIRKQFTGTGGDTFAVHSLNMYTVTP